MRTDTFINSNHYPFGMQMPGRNHNSSDYRYGFSGKEKDDELKTNGNSYDFGARIYDPRLGRWLAVDPMVKKYPAQSSYAFALNSPLIFIDKGGKDVILTSNFQSKSELSTALSVLTKSQTFREIVQQFNDLNNGVVVKKNQEGIFDTKTGSIDGAKSGDLGNTNLVFDYNQDLPRGGGNTTPFAKINGEDVQISGYMSEEVIQEIGSKLTRETEINISINLGDPVKEGGNVEVQLHEIALHTQGITRLIKQFREGKLDGVQFLTEVQKMQNAGGDNHDQLEKISGNYFDMAKEVIKKMSRNTRADFKKAVVGDVQANQPPKERKGATVKERQKNEAKDRKEVVKKIEQQIAK